MPLAVCRYRELSKWGGNVESSGTRVCSQAPQGAFKLLPQGAFHFAAALGSGAETQHIPPELRSLKRIAGQLPHCSVGTNNAIAYQQHLLGFSASARQLLAAIRAIHC